MADEFFLPFVQGMSRCLLGSCSIEGKGVTSDAKFCQALHLAVPDVDLQREQGSAAQGEDSCVQRLHQQDGGIKRPIPNLLSWYTHIWQSRKKGLLSNGRIVPAS